MLENDTHEPSALGPASPISVADLLALRIQVHWTEAVALVEEICAVLIDDVPEISRAPQPQDLFLTAQGAVLERRGAPRPDGVDDIGRLLNALLDPQSTPIPLRLFVTQAIGSERYATLKAYGDALAYYSRPGRAELIRALYLRCLEAPAPDSSQPLPVPEDAAPVEEPEPKKSSARRRRALLLVPAAAVTLVACAAALWWGSGGQVNALASVRDIVTQAGDAVVALIPGGTSGSLADSGAPVEREEGRTTAGRGGRASRSSGGTDTAGVPPMGAVPEIPTIALTPLIIADASEGGLARPPAPGADDASDSPAGTEIARESEPTVDETIYTSASPDVEPPVMYEPKLPPVPAADSGLPGTNTMELIIDEAGDVRQVRLTSRPRRITDMMLLSPAKTWKFHPARRNGRPVKYRLTMSWTVAPP